MSHRLRAHVAGGTMHVCSCLIRFWLLACLVLLVTTNEEAQEYYGVDQSEGLAVVTEPHDTDIKTDIAWSRLQKTTPQLSGQSDLVSSVRRRLSSKRTSEAASGSRRSTGASYRNPPYCFCCASFSVYFSAHNKIS